jgi:hypothetical protein
MIAQTLCGLFEKPARAEAALDELQRAGFLDAEISELVPADATASDMREAVREDTTTHINTGSDFRGNLIAAGVREEDAAYFEYGIERGAALVTVQTSTRPGEALEILTRHGAEIGNQPIVVPVEVYTQPSAVPEEFSAVEASRSGNGALRITRRRVVEEIAFDIQPTGAEPTSVNHAYEELPQFAAPPRR